MGLENGIIIRTNPDTASIFEEVKPRDFKWALNEGFAEFENTEVMEAMPCYWRKCWGLRDEICSAIWELEGGGEILLFKEDLKKIWHIINKFNNKKVWNSYSSIWDYSDIRDTLDQQLYNIEYLIFMMSDPLWDGEIYFFDSY